MSLKDKSLAKKGKAIMKQSEEGDTGSGKMHEDEDEYGDEKEEKSEEAEDESEGSKKSTKKCVN